MGFGSDALDRFAIAGDERRPLDQIAGWVSADRQFRKKNQSGAGALGALREIDDLGGVAGEVSDRGIDLAQRNLHFSSVKRGTP